MRFGSALEQESQKNEVISIPGLRGRPHKEISVNTLAQIIEARMEEILDLVLFEIKNSGYDRKLAGGIVITGGGSQLKHLNHLVMIIIFVEEIHLEEINIFIKFSSIMIILREEIRVYVIPI